MCWTGAVHRAHRFSLGPPASYQLIGDPRERWPRERDLLRWLLDNPGPLAECLGMDGVEFTGREIVIGEQVLRDDILGRARFMGGLRADAVARDEHGQLIIIEAQLGPADHTHLGQLVTYAHAARATAAVWVVAGTDPSFFAEQLSALAELNEVFAGRRLFSAIAITLESQPRPERPAPDDPLLPRMRRVSLADHTLADGRGTLPAQPSGSRELARGRRPIEIARTSGSDTEPYADMLSRADARCGRSAR
jgi:hypothetical protein